MIERDILRMPTLMFILVALIHALHLTIGLALGEPIASSTSESLLGKTFITVDNHSMKFVSNQEVEFVSGGETLRAKYAIQPDGQIKIEFDSQGERKKVSLNIVRSGDLLEDNGDQPKPGVRYYSPNNIDNAILDKLLNQESSLDSDIRNELNEQKRNDLLKQLASLHEKIFTQAATGAKNGGSTCMFWLSQCYRGSFGVEKNQQLEEMWLKKAIEAGDADACIPSCAANMRDIGLAMLNHANGSFGKLPRTLSDLASTEAVSANLFICPSSGDEPAKNQDKKSWSEMIIPGNGHCSYIYCSGVLGMDPEKVLMYEPITNHDGKGANFLYADGHVEWENYSNAKKMIHELEMSHKTHPTDSTVDEKEGVNSGSDGKFINKIQGIWYASAVSGSEKGHPGKVFVVKVNKDLTARYQTADDLNEITLDDKAVEYEYIKEDSALMPKNNNGASVNVPLAFTSDYQFLVMHANAPSDKIRLFRKYESIEAIRRDQQLPLEASVSKVDRIIESLSKNNVICATDQNIANIFKGKFSNSNNRFAILAGIPDAYVTYSGPVFGFKQDETVVIQYNDCRWVIADVAVPQNESLAGVVSKTRFSLKPARHRTFVLSNFRQNKEWSNWSPGVHNAVGEQPVPLAVIDLITKNDGTIQADIRYMMKFKPRASNEKEPRIVNNQR